MSKIQRELLEFCRLVWKQNGGHSRSFARWRRVVPSKHIEMDNDGLWRNFRDSVTDLHDTLTQLSQFCDWPTCTWYLDAPCVKMKEDLTHIWRTLPGGQRVRLTIDKCIISTNSIGYFSSNCIDHRQWTWIPRQPPKQHRAHPTVVRWQSTANGDRWGHAIRGGRRSYWTPGRADVVCRWTPGPQTDRGAAAKNKSQKTQVKR